MIEQAEYIMVIEEKKSQLKPMWYAGRDGMCLLTHSFMGKI